MAHPIKCACLPSCKRTHTADCGPLQQQEQKQKQQIHHQSRYEEETRLDQQQQKHPGLEQKQQLASNVMPDESAITEHISRGPDPCATANLLINDANEDAASTRGVQAAETPLAMDAVQTPSELLAGEKQEQDAVPHTELLPACCRLHIFAGHVPAEYAHCRTFYCVRIADGPLPADGMGKLLDCGLLAEAPSLQVLQQVCTY